MNQQVRTLMAALAAIALYGLSPQSMAQTCVTATSNDTFHSTAISPAQTGTFTFGFDATPSASRLNAVVALSKGSQTAYTGYATLVRFNNVGMIDAYNGTKYAATNAIPFAAGVTYHVREVVDAVNRAYSVYVTGPSGTEQTLATNFLFRSEQSTVSSIDHWAVQANSSNAGTLTACVGSISSSSSSSVSSSSSSTSSSSSVSSSSSSSSGGGIAIPPNAAPNHDTSKAPGQNFNLSTWKMTTGSGSNCNPGLRPAAMAAGATAPHFSTDTTTGAMTLVASSADCITSNTSHPRTEFRELWKGDPDPSGSQDTSSGWTIAGTHILDVWMSVTGTNTIVGQIHPISGGSNLPLLKCYYTGSGMSCTMEKSLTTSGTASTLSFSGLTQGTPFFYRISYTNKKVCVSVGANPTAALSGTKCATPDASFLSSTLLNYFKVGNYNQGGGTTTAKVYYLNTYHAP